MSSFGDHMLDIVANDSREALVGYNFMLRIEGAIDLPCKAVHSFEKKNNFDKIQEGGINDYVHMLRKPVEDFFTFTIERYVGSDPTTISPLPLGAEFVLPLVLMVSAYPDDFEHAKRTFVFTGCTVMEKAYGELNSEKSELLTETVTIGYREMVEVTVPVAAGKPDTWKFDKNKSNKTYFKGIGPTVHQKLESQKPERRYSFGAEYTDDKKNDFKSQVKVNSAKKIKNDVDWSKKPDARQWKFDKDNIAGSGDRSATVLKQSEPDARQWKFDKNNIAGTGDISRKRIMVQETDEEGNPIEYDRSLVKTGKRQWKFDKDNIAGSGDRSATVLKQSEPDARQWKFDKNNIAGTGDISRKRIMVQETDEKGKTIEYDRSLVKTGKRQWKFDKDNIAGSGDRSATVLTQSKPERRYSFGTTYKDKVDKEWDAFSKQEEKRSAHKIKDDVKWEEKPDARQWKIDKDNIAGSGDRSATVLTQSKPERRYSFGTTYKDKVDKEWDAFSKQEEKRSAHKIKDDVKWEEKPDARQWKFDKDNIAGSGDRSATVLKQSEPDARQWKFDKNNVEGTGTSSRRSHESDLDKVETEKRLWEFDGREAVGTGESSRKTHDLDKIETEKRKWPKISSAKTLNDTSKKDV